MFLKQDGEDPVPLGVTTLVLRKQNHMSAIAMMFCQQGRLISSVAQPIRDEAHLLPLAIGQNHGGAIARWFVTNIPCNPNKFHSGPSKSASIDMSFWTNR